MRGPQNEDSTRDYLESQSLTYDKANVAFDGSIIGYLSLDCTLRALNIIGCVLGYCIHLGH